MRAPWLREVGRGFDGSEELGGGSIDSVELCYMKVFAFGSDARGREFKGASREVVAYVAIGVEEDVSVIEYVREEDCKDSDWASERFVPLGAGAGARGVCGGLGLNRGVEENLMDLLGVERGVGK